jgi:hypothetical protein
MAVLALSLPMFAARTWFNWRDRRQRELQLIDTIEVAVIPVLVGAGIPLLLSRPIAAVSNTMRSPASTGTTFSRLYWRPAIIALVRHRFA